MRVGLQHVRQSPRMRAVCLRVFLFFLQASALLALLPLLARNLHGGGAATFTVLMACIGAGAIFAALRFPRWRRRFGRDEFVLYGTLVHAAATAAVALVPELWVAVPGCLVAGMAWISTANTLSIAAQVALPDWVRARGMAIYQMALMGGTAFGAMLYGQVASLGGVPVAVLSAAAVGVALLPWLRRYSVAGEEVDHSPAPVRAPPDLAIDLDPDEGPVMVTVEYQIDPARAAEFAQVMQLTRAARLRQGALSWGLFRDTAVPGRYVEYFIDESWVEHQRRLERFSAADAELRERRLGFHVLREPPQLRRYVADRPH
jgi:MFS family permease